MLTFYRNPKGHGHSTEECIYVDGNIGPQELERLKWLLDSPDSILSDTSQYRRGQVVEIGPRLAVESPFSSRATEICKRVGINASRIELSVRIPRMGQPVEKILTELLDPMTQELYRVPLTTFGEVGTPAPARIIPVSRDGKDALRKEGVPEDELEFYLELCAEGDPTDAVIALLRNALSDHCRHSTIKGRVVIDGTLMPHNIMELVQAPWKRNPGNSMVAFHDNAGVLRGHTVTRLMPEFPGQPGRFVERSVLVHITITAETHNHPCFISPTPGAETGVGGLLRDEVAQGLGALYLGINGAGYCTSNLHIPGYVIPGEELGGEQSARYAPALRSIIEMSNGACDYANKMGRPITFGFCRSFDQMVGGKRRGWLKPICYIAGVARVDNRHMFKRPAEAGMLIMGLGGQARRIGVGGGAASSVEGGINAADIDFASVQRGDAIEESCANRALRAAAEMGESNPIIDLSDQGAGGPGNLFFELVGKLGGRIDLRKISCADLTMSSLERLIGEYQERYGFVIRKENLPITELICRRENVNLEVLGEITADGRFVVDSADGVVVDLSIAKALMDLPQKKLVWDRVPKALVPLVIPEGLTVAKALKDVFAQLGVGSKGFLVRKGDRSVGGLVALQQCVGPKHVPVADASVMADSYFALTGSASALGEQPIVGLVNAKAGGRTATAEMLTNVCSVLISAIPDIKCRLNEMCAAKQPGEGAELYDAVEASCELMERMRFAPNGGKDSLSMAAKTDVGETVVAPGQLVVFGTAPVEDITKVATPVLEGGGTLMFIDIGQGKNRLGGSAFVQSLGQLGDDCPDIDDPDLLSRALEACQQMLREGLLTAYHDRSDGGLITTLVEMCLAGNCGAYVDIGHTHALPHLFNQEAGVVVEFRREDTKRIQALVDSYGLGKIAHHIGYSRTDARRVTIVANGRRVLDQRLSALRAWWEATSDRLELVQSNPQTVKQEMKSYRNEHEIPMRVSFTPRQSPALVGLKPPQAAVVRVEGTNGDDEMVGALTIAGFEVHGIAMCDILSGAVTSFYQFRGIAFPGGFADGDVFGAAKGWAAPILFDERVKTVFDRFYEREDTFSLGVCNGCQLMANIGWLPYRGLVDASQPRLGHNRSGRFESRWVGVKVNSSPSILLRGMEGSVLGVWVAHGEGRFVFPDRVVRDLVYWERLNSLVYVDTDGNETESYPYNPNGSPMGLAGMCSLDGRHLAMMPHPERCFLPWQWPWMPKKFRQLEASPWLQMFQNARAWCK